MVVELLSNPAFLQVVVVLLAAFSTVSVALNVSGTQRKRNAAIRKCEGLLDLLRDTIKLLKKEMAKPRPTLAPPVVREVLPVGPIEKEDLTQEQMEAIFSASGTPSTEEKNDDEG